MKSFLLSKKKTNLSPIKNNVKTSYDADLLFLYKEDLQVFCKEALLVFKEKNFFLYFMKKTVSSSSKKKKIK